MSDITDLFHRVAPDADGSPSAETVDADLARGREALLRHHRRRTIRRSMLATSTIAAGVAVVLVVAQLTGAGTTHHTTATPRSHHPAAHQNVKHRGSKPAARRSAIKLIAYHGKQLEGFTVDKVPAGWHLSTSTQFALLIDPKGDTDNDPDAFVGKLAVLTQSSDVHHLPKGTPVTVDGEDGVVTDQGKYGENLSYNTANGIGIVIQAPAQLAWSDSQIVAFAEGVHMTNDAVASRG